MYKIKKILIIIYDDYNNILAIQKGKNKEMWSLIGKELSGKENKERCIVKLVSKDLGCTVFNLKQFKQYPINENEEFLVYSGIIRERIACHKNISKVKWISKIELDTYGFLSIEKEILTDFFAK